MLSVLLAFMSSLRIMWGRSVQPHRELDDLAPVIGAIRIGGAQAVRAGAWLSGKIIEAHQNNSHEFLELVKKFSTQELGDHRNYQVWVAIVQLLDSGNFAPSKLHYEAGQAAGFPPEYKPRFFPNLSELKNYVKSQRDAKEPGFGNLPPRNDSTGWIRLLKSSGADLFIEDGPIGRPRRE